MSVEQQLLDEAEIWIKSFEEMRIASEPDSDTEDNLLLAVLSNVPFFNKMFKELRSTTAAITILTNTADKQSNMLKVSPVLGLVLNAIDFIQIPFVYAASLILGKKPPITYLNNSKWLYAAVMLALCITAFALPGAAPAIAIVMASLALTAGLITLGRVFYQYKLDKKALADNPVTKMEQLMLELKTESEHKNVAEIEKIIEKIVALDAECEKKPGGIKALYREKLTLEAKIKIEDKVLDASVGIILSSLAIAGTVILLIFPPVGLTILAAVTIVGCAFAITQIAILCVSKLREDPKTQPVAVDTTLTIESTPGMVNSLSPQETFSPLHSKIAHEPTSIPNKIETEAPSLDASEEAAEEIESESDSSTSPLIKRK